MPHSDVSIECSSDVTRKQFTSSSLAPTWGSAGSVSTDTTEGKTWSAAGSVSTEAAEAPWSSSESIGSRDDTGETAGEDSDSCTDQDIGSCPDEHDDYYKFLRDFAGSFDAGDAEEDLDSEPDTQHGSRADEQHDDYCEFLRDFAGSYDAGSEEEAQDGSESEFASQCGDDDAEQKQVGAAAQPPQRKRSCALSSTDMERQVQEGGCARSRALADGQPQTDALDKATSSDSEEEAEEEVLSDSDDEPLAYKQRNMVPVEDDYDVTKAVQHYASQRPGNAMQRCYEDMQAAIRLRQMQALRLKASATTNLHLDPHVRAHYAKTRIELLVEAKAIEARFIRMFHPKSRG